MNRLPRKFEQEVLEKHVIKFKDKVYYREHYIAPIAIQVSPYEIAALGLEAMKLQGYWNEQEEQWWNYNGDMHITINDKDFCECVFKAIREVYKDENN